MGIVHMTICNPKRMCCHANKLLLAVHSARSSLAIHESDEFLKSFSLSSLPRQELFLKTLRSERQLFYDLSSLDSRYSITSLVWRHTSLQRLSTCFSGSGSVVIL